MLCISVGLTKCICHVSTILDSYRSFKSVYFKPHACGCWSYYFKIENLSTVIDYSRRDSLDWGNCFWVILNFFLPPKEGNFVVVAVVYSFKISGLEGTLRVVKVLIYIKCSNWLYFQVALHVLISCIILKVMISVDLVWQKCPSLSLRLWSQLQELRNSVTGI